MRCLIPCVLTLFFVAACLPAEAGNRGGIQAVLFPRWSSASVSNLVAVVNDVKPAEFELSQCPYFGDPGSRYENTTQFLQQVNAPTRLMGTFFLSFHTDQTYTLSDRAVSFNKYLIEPKTKLGGLSPLQRFSTVVVSPQLEESYNDATWLAKTTEILDKLDVSILTSGKLRLRRSVQGQVTNLAMMEYKRSSKSYFFEVRVERHGVATTPVIGVWSNDGDFVHSDTVVGGIGEDASSLADAVTPTFAKMPLKTYAAAAKTRAGAVTLWRPAYNLLRRETINGKVRWTRDDRNAWTRADSAISFDQRERQVLREFLRSL